MLVEFDIAWGVEGPACAEQEKEDRHILVQAKVASKSNDEPLRIDDAVVVEESTRALP